MIRTCDRRNLIKKLILSCLVLSILSAGLAHAQLNAHVAATSQQVQSFFGTNNVKVVFTTDSLNSANAAIGTITWYVDFSEATPQIRRLNIASISVNLPVISPDGNWVVFRDGIVAEVPAWDPVTSTCDSRYNGKVFLAKLQVNATPVTPTVIAQLGFSPRFDYRVCTASQLGIIYPNSMCGIGGQDPHLGGSKTVRTLVDISGSAPVVGRLDTVWASGGYNAGISRDGKFLAAQYPGVNTLITNISLGTNVAIPMNQYKGKNCSTQADMTITSNTCNGSISSSTDKPGAVLFYTGVLNPTGFCTSYGTWGPHQRLIVKDTANKILRTIGLPPIPVCIDDVTQTGFCPSAGEVFSTIEWMNPEWSNHPYFAAAAINVNRIYVGEVQKVNNEHVYAVNLKDSTFLRLVTTSDTSVTSKVSMRYPWLWVSTAGLTEVPGWLDDTTGIIQRSIANKAFAGAKLSINREMLISDAPLKFVGIYTALGTLMSSVDTRQASTVDLPHNMMCGIFFIKAETMDGKKAICRWIVGK